mgnify:CR=1 FL=1
MDKKVQKMVKMSQFEYPDRDLMVHKRNIPTQNHATLKLMNLILSDLDPGTQKSLPNHISRQN